MMLYGQNVLVNEQLCELAIPFFKEGCDGPDFDCSEFNKVKTSSFYLIWSLNSKGY